MPFDALVANPGRLKILTALAVEERQEFVDLRRRTRLTDGNLAAHAKRLQAGGLIHIDKLFRDGKPVTRLSLTPGGRTALEAHAHTLLAALGHGRLPRAADDCTDTATPAPAAGYDPSPDQDVADDSTWAEEDWVD